MFTSGCSNGKKQTAARDTNPRGGTLRVVEPRDISTISTVKPPFDQFGDQPALDRVALRPGS